MGVRRWIPITRAVGALVVGVTATALVAGPVVAADEGGAESGGKDAKAVCQFTATMTLSPGLPAPTPTTPVSFTTVDEVADEPGHATLQCTKGRVNGIPVDTTRTGSYLEYGSTTGDCASGHGTGVYEAWIPVQGGRTEYLTGGFQLWYFGPPPDSEPTEPPIGTGYEIGESIDATFTFRPTSGTCQPDNLLTEFVLDQDETLYT